MENLDPPARVGQFDPQWLDWQDLCRGPLYISTHHIQAVGLIFSEKFPNCSLWKLLILEQGQFES